MGTVSAIHARLLRSVVARHADTFVFDQRTLLEAAKRVSVTTVQHFDFMPDRADGPFIWDRAGRRYFDCSSGIGAVPWGYNHPYVRQVIETQLKSGLWNSCDSVWPNRMATVVKELLCEVTPGDFPKKAFLCNSGAEAVEAAIKILLAKRPERTAFIAFNGAFHGRTIGALSFNGSKLEHRKHFPQALAVYRLPFPELGHMPDREWDKQVEKLFAEVHLERTNAIFLELVQGEGGINVADLIKMRVLIEKLRQYDVKIVVDEIQTGLFRTGRLWASDTYGVEPDIMCLGKSLGGGAMPVGAVVIRAELDFDKQGRHGSTAGGNPLAASAALASLKVAASLDEEILKERIVTLKKFAPDGLGFMRRHRFETAGIRDRYVAEALKLGVILFASGERSVRFMPQITLERKQLDEVIDVLKTIKVP